MRQEHAVGVLVCGNPLDMGYLRGRLVGDGPAARPQAPAEVDVLHVHEIRAVEAAHLVPGLTPGQETGARDPVDLPGAGVVPVHHPVAARKRVARPKLTDHPVPEGLQ